MTLAKRARLVAIGAVMGLAALSLPSYAQEFSEEHLKAARATVSALGATDEFDNVLPIAAQQLKAELIQQSPNLVNEINSTVDAKALELASRRADLEKEVASIYAQAFTIEELNAINTFYSSEAGKALIAKGPLVSREMLAAAEIWRNGIMRDLSSQVVEAIGASLKAQAPAQPAPEQKK
jgi:hypothetical protein